METWQHNLAKSITRLDQIAARLPIDTGKLKPVIDRYPVRITPYYFGLIREIDDPIGRQCIPDIRELAEDGSSADPLNEEGLSPVPGLIHRYPDRAVLLVGGRVEAQGDPSDVTNRYVGMVLAREQPQFEQDDTWAHSSYRHGDGTSRVESVWLLNEYMQPTRTIRVGEVVTIKLRAQFRRDCMQPIAGILIRNRLGMDVFGTNTRVEGRHMGVFHKDDRMEVEFRFECRLAQQEYTLTVATQHWDGSSQDWLNDALSFRVVDPKAGVAGVIDLETETRWRRIPKPFIRPGLQP